MNFFWRMFLFPVEFGGSGRKLPLDKGCSLPSPQMPAPPSLVTLERLSQDMANRGGAEAEVQMR